MYNENIERMFMQEVREKKRAGYGAFHMRGKGVKHGSNQALRTPFYYLSNKEKKKLNGEVESYNMFETIIPISEFDLKDKETRRNLLIKWREVYENKEITAQMGITNKRYFDLIAELDIPKKPRGGARNGTGAPRKSRAKKPEIVETNEKVEVQQQLNLVPEIQKIITKGLYLEYNGEYNAEELNKLFTKLQLLVDGEPNKFNLTLSLTEKKK